MVLNNTGVELFSSTGTIIPIKKRQFQSINVGVKTAWASSVVIKLKYGYY